MYSCFSVTYYTNRPTGIGEFGGAMAIGQAWLESLSSGYVRQYHFRVVFIIRKDHRGSVGQRSRSAITQKPLTYAVALSSNSAQIQLKLLAPTCGYPPPPGHRPVSALQEVFKVLINLACTSAACRDYALFLWRNLNVVDVRKLWRYFIFSDATG